MGMILLSQEEITESYGDYREMQGLSQGLSQGLTSHIQSLKKFYADFESLYVNEIASNPTYSQFSK